MIESTIDEAEGVRFIHTSLVPPYETRNGIKIERIIEKLMFTPEVMGVVKQLGLKYVGYDVETDCGLYTHTWLGSIQYRCTKKIIGCYWRVIRFLYLNARMFQIIPEGECFSSRYFTPYAWGRKWLSKTTK